MVMGFLVKCSNSECCLCQDISKTERKDVMRQIKPGSRSWIRLVKMVPQCMLYAHIHYILVPVMGSNWVELLLKVLSPPDVSNLNLQVSRDLIERSVTLNIVKWFNLLTACYHTSRYTLTSWKYFIAFSGTA
jgi:hypothetical protein